MFTDQPVTPTRVEVLVDFLRSNRSSKITRQLLLKLFQPSPILDSDERKRDQADWALKAAEQIRLIEKGDVIKLTFERGDKRTTREIVHEAFDQFVLSDISVEPFFAPFYSFLLALNENGTISNSTSDAEAWERKFAKEVNRGERIANPFNPSKLTGLRRWYEYVGLGWFDPTGTFQPNPYYRVRRRLKKIFGGSRKLSSNDFMTSLAVECPELDGGAIYRETTKYMPLVNEQMCTLGLSHALVDLHADSVIRLDCPVDAYGWDISRAEPPYDRIIKSKKIRTVELLKIK